MHVVCQPGNDPSLSDPSIPEMLRDPCGKRVLLGRSLVEVDIQTAEDVAITLRVGVVLRDDVYPAIGPNSGRELIGQTRRPPDEHVVVVLRERGRPLVGSGERAAVCSRHSLVGARRELDSSAAPGVMT